MHQTVELRYPASVAEVAAMISDVEFLKWRAKRTATTGTLEAADVDRRDDGGFTVVIRRSFPTEFIPPQVMPLVGSSIQVRQAEVWQPQAPDGSQQGTLAQEIAGAPVRILGTVRLEPLPNGGTRQVYEGTISVTIPLFRDVVAKGAATRIKATLAAEEAAGRAWLAGDRT